MELCWENLDRIHLTKKGDFCLDNGRVYIYKESCKNCNKPFFASNKTIKYCCLSCANTGKNNPNFGKKHSQETKDKISKINVGKFIGEDCPNYKGGVKKLDLPLYDTYAPQFPESFEETRPIIENGLKLLQVRCHNSDCKKWFRPKLFEVKNRRCAFYIGGNGHHNFYCSDECKKTCSTYRQITWPKGENPNKQNLPYTNDEYLLYRKTVMGRENYICEYCGKPATDVHHEKPKKTDPMLVLDPDYGHACCKECHYKYGHKTGTECSTGNLAKKIC